MIASIDNVAKIAERRREATEELLGTVGGGGDKMRAAFEHVRQISESLESVNGIASIIKSISAQTNLLAMNAAIEAAHAGDAGRGFSVVADEIRKLAEASSSNSQEISHILGGVSSSVEDAAVSAELLNSAFFQIDREVRELSNSLREIFGNMAELRSGSSQILEAMETLRRVSTRVRDKSSAISEQSGSIREVAETGKSTGSDVRAGMADIVVGMKEISTAVDDVLAIARRIGKVGEGLNSEITRFRTS
jgi:methyl-accepting chemotaxis protein